MYRKLRKKAMCSVLYVYIQIADSPKAMPKKNSDRFFKRACGPIFMA